MSLGPPGASLNPDNAPNSEAVSLQLKHLKARAHVDIGRAGMVDDRSVV